MRFLLVLAFALIFQLGSNSIVRAATDSGGSGQSTTSKNKSRKKSQANSVRIKPPQVLEEGDVDLGLRAAGGGIYNGSPIIAVSIERMMKPNFGLGALLGYSSYTTDLTAGPYSEEVDSTVWVAGIVGAFHADVLNVKNLDTFLSAGFAHAFYSTTVRGPYAGYYPGATVGIDTNFFLAYLNARYFIDSNWGFTASVGTGLGFLSLGADYLF